MVGQYTVDLRGKHVTTVRWLTREASNKRKKDVGGSRPMLIDWFAQKMEADIEEK